MNIESIADSIMQKFIGLSHGVRVMMLIDRSMGNTNKGSRRWINKLVSTNTDQFRANLEKLLELQYYLDNPDIRLYSCVNDRKLHKAIKHFQHKQLDIATNEEEIDFYLNINSKFCSSLMKPENRNSNLFLIDVDSDSLVNAAIKEILLAERELFFNSQFLEYKTPNGYHLITTPFNPQILYSRYNQCDLNYEIKKDALILLHYLEVKNES